MAFHEEQSGADPLFGEGHPLFDELMEITDEENMTVSELQDFLRECLMLGVKRKTGEDIVHARRQISKFIDIVERREIMADRKALENEGKLIELNQRLKPSDSTVLHGAMATVTPLFKKEEDTMSVEAVVAAKAIERPRTHLRLIK